MIPPCAMESANQEKIRIARVLSEIGVEQIEAGIPVMGGDERDAVRAIVRLGLPASIVAWNRAVIDDIRASIDCGVDAIAISIRWISPSSTGCTYRSTRKTHQEPIPASWPNFAARCLTPAQIE